MSSKMMQLYQQTSTWSVAPPRPPLVWNRPFLMVLMELESRRYLRRTSIRKNLIRSTHFPSNMCRPGSSSLTIRERFPLALLDRYLGIFLLRRYDAGIVDLSGLGWECSLFYSYPCFAPFISFAPHLIK